MEEASLGRGRPRTKEALEMRLEAKEAEYEAPKAEVALTGLEGGEAA
jgi:hypothetical protein